MTGLRIKFWQSSAGDVTSNSRQAEEYFLMDTSIPHKSYNLEIQIPAGNLTTSVSVPTGWISITDIIPLMRSLGEQAHQLAINHTTQTGATISCQKGCAVCCRMMIPLAPRGPCSQNYRRGTFIL